MRCFWRHFRLHDTVIIGGHGPKQVLQHHGANEYQFKIDDLKTVQEGRDPGMVHWYVIYEKILKMSFSRMISFPLLTETWKISTNKLRQFFFCFKWHFRREKYFGKHLFLQNKNWLRPQDFATGKNFSFHQCHYNWPFASY